jgi:RNA polymerase sigma factor (TIGR02999 family)
LDLHEHVTTLLNAMRRGDEEALSRLFDVLYQELRRIAHGQLARAPGRNTLNTTEVVHEAYLKLFGHGAVALQDRTHFFAVASRAMRQILVDRARMRLAQKRGGGAERVELDENDIHVDDCAEVIAGLDRALKQLSGLDDRLAHVVELRFFGGLSFEEAAEVLGISERTARRDWTKARAFLYQELYGT